MIPSLDADKAFYKKNKQTLGAIRDTRGTPKHNKDNLQKPIANFQLNGEKLNAIPLKSGRRLYCPLSPYLFNIVLKVLARAIRQLTEKRWFEMERKKSKYHYLQVTCVCGCVYVCVYNSIIKNSTN